MRRALAALLAVAATLAAAWPGAAADSDAARDALARGDAAFLRRAEGHDGDGRARPAPIGEAIRAYEEAVAADPERLEAHWKLLRAYHFAGDFSAPDAVQERVLWERATAASEQALDALARRVGGRRVLDALAPAALGSAFAPGDRRDAAAIHFWSAVVWGAWSSRQGLLAVVREGVANRLHRYAEAVVALDPGHEEGGAHRLLARLHATLPRVPLLSGWVDRERALPEMERALAAAPRHPGNRMLLALTLLDVAPLRRGEALALLEEVAASEPRAAQLVEDLAIRRSARERLAEERAKGA